MDRIASESPRIKARVAGVFWLLTILTGVIAIFVRGRLVVYGDAAATAANILTHEAMFRLSFTADMIGVFCYIAVTLLVYDLLRPVNRTVSLLAAFFSLVGCAIGAFSCLLCLAPLIVLGDAPYLNVFEVEQLHAFALVFIKLRAQANNIGLVFFGFHCLLIGHLILRSTFLPPIVGALMVFGGMGWLTFLVPPLATFMLPYILVPGILGEGSLALWFLVMGVKTQRWQEQASK